MGLASLASIAFALLSISQFSILAFCCLLLMKQGNTKFVLDESKVQPKIRERSWPLPKDHSHFWRLPKMSCYPDFHYFCCPFAFLFLVNHFAPSYLAIIRSTIYSHCVTPNTDGKYRVSIKLDSRPMPAFSINEARNRLEWVDWGFEYLSEFQREALLLNPGLNIKYLHPGLRLFSGRPM